MTHYSVLQACFTGRERQAFDRSLRGSSQQAGKTFTHGKNRLNRVDAGSGRTNTVKIEVETFLNTFGIKRHGSP